MAKPQNVFNKINNINCIKIGDIVKFEYHDDEKYNERIKNWEFEIISFVNNAIEMKCVKHKKSITINYDDVNIFKKKFINSKKKVVSVYDKLLYGYKQISMDQIKVGDIIKHYKTNMATGNEMPKMVDNIKKENGVIVKIVTYCGHEINNDEVIMKINQESNSIRVTRDQLIKISNSPIKKNNDFVCDAISNNKKFNNDVNKMCVIENNNIDVKYIYHIADIHIDKYDNGREIEYEKIYDKLYNSIKPDNAILYIAGDIIDFKLDSTPYGFNQLFNFIEKMSQIIPIVLIAGNHDVNVHDKNKIDLLSIIIPRIKSNNNIYYLRNTGLYKYNNIIFSVSSVFDKMVIPINNIDKSDEIVIGLHHGLVLGKEHINFSKLLNQQYIESKEFDGYDFVMLGDQHKLKFITPTIAYSSSMIQRNFGESINNHGYILWDLYDNNIPGQFYELENEYAFLNLKFKDNKLENEYQGELPQNLKIKVIHQDTEESIIKDYINQLKLKYNVINSNNYQKILKHGILNYDLNISSNDDINYSYDNTRDIFKNYVESLTLEPDNDYTDDDIKNICEMYEKYENKCTINLPTKRNVKLLDITFDNIAAYGENNKFTFKNSDKGLILGLDGPNYSGKSTIIEIILYMLFDRFLTDNKEIKSFKNIHKNNCKIELKLMVDDNQYIIIKKIEKKKSMSILKCIDDKFINLDKIPHNILNNIDKQFSELLNLTGNASTCLGHILGFTFEDFIMSCLMSISSVTEISEMDNKKRIAMMMSLLKYDIINKISKCMAPDIVQLKKSIENCDNKLKNYDNIDIINKLKNIPVKILELKNKKTELKSLNKIYDDNKCKISEKLYHIDDDNLNNKLKKIINDKKILLSNKKKLEIDNNKYNNIRTKIESIVFDKICNNNKSVKINKFDSYIKTPHNNFDSLISELHRVMNDDKINYENELKIINKNIINIKNKIKQKKLNDKYYDEINELEIIISKNNNEIDEIDNQLMNLIKDETRLNQINNEYQYLNNKYKTNMISYDKIVKCNNILSSSKFRTFMFNIVRTNLENSMNIILSNVSKFNVELFVTDGKKIQGDFTIKKKCDGKYYALSHCSGFEKLCINVAFKLSLHKLNIVSCPRILIIDESISCVDNKNFYNFKNLYSQIKSMNGHCILISHNENIKNTCDKLIKICTEYEYNSIKY